MATPVTEVEGVVLNREAVRVARCTVERLMKALGLHGAPAAIERCAPTCSDPAAPRPADLVERNFNPSRPDALWAADFSSRATWAGFRLRGVRHRRVQPAEFRMLSRGPNWIGVLPLGAASMTAGQFSL
jgi:transposase InsO family protein